MTEDQRFWRCPECGRTWEWMSFGESLGWGLMVCTCGLQHAPGRCDGGR